MIKSNEELSINHVSDSERNESVDLISSETKLDRRVSFNKINKVHVIPSRIDFSNEDEIVINSISNKSDVPIKPFNNQTMKEFSTSEEFWKDLLTLQDIALVPFEDSKSMLSVFDDCALTFENLSFEIDNIRDTILDEINSPVQSGSNLDEDEFKKESFEDALKSPCFWNDIHAMHMETAVKDHNSSGSTQSPALMEDLLSVFGTCGDTMDDLAHELSAFQEQLKLSDDITVGMANLEMNGFTSSSSPNNLDKFISAEDFWDEVIAMHVENEISSIPTDNVQVIEARELLDSSYEKEDLEKYCTDALDVFSECGDSIATLAKALQEFSTSMLDHGEFTSANEDSLDHIKPFIHSESFWSEIINMQTESKSSIEVLHFDITSIHNISKIDSDAGALMSGDKTQIVEENDTSPPIVTTKVPDRVDEVLRCGTMKDDMSVVLMKPVKQVYPWGSHVDTIEEEVAMKLISTEIQRRSRNGPNIKFFFSVFMLACLSVLLVALFGSQSTKLYRILWATAFGVNVVTVTIPGRLDRMYCENSHIKPWTSLFEPAPWAFAIWAIIYLFEMMLTLYVTFIGFPPQMFQRTLPYWLAGNWFQALWCFAFRPEFKRHLWVPTTCLVLAALSFYGAHNQICMYMAKVGDLNLAQNLLIQSMKVPLSLHSSWLVASALVIFNSWATLTFGRASRGLQVMIAFASAFACAAIGISLTYHTRDPCFALTSAWSLDAVACRTQSKTKGVKGIVSADVQESLAAAENTLSTVLKCVVAGALITPYFSENIAQNAIY